MSRRLTAIPFDGCAPRKHVSQELPIHRAILQFLRVAVPGALVNHCPNEHSGTGPAIAREIAKQRSMGTIKGWPDLEVMLPGGRTLFLEVKAPKGTVSEAQAGVMAQLSALGHPCAVVRSIDDVKDVLRSLEAVPSAAVPFRGVVS